MGRIEVITRTERRRKYSPAERDAIMREADAPDVTVREVAKRHDIAESLIYSWRTARRQAEKIASKPLTFISYGAVPEGAIATVPAAQPPVLAHVVVSKFADHLPLYRQSRIYAREGVDLSRSTLADWLGQVSWLLQPLVALETKRPFLMAAAVPMLRG